MPERVAVIAATMLIQSNRPAARRQADPAWRESQRQQRRSEFWQTLMSNDRG